jgi:hypothetical protein
MSNQQNVAQNHNLKNNNEVTNLKFLAGTVINQNYSYIHDGLKRILIFYTSMSYLRA